MPEDTLQFPSGIRDNRERGTVGEFLQDHIENGSSLSIVSAYFTIYAYEALEIISARNQRPSIPFRRNRDSSEP